MCRHLASARRLFASLLNGVFRRILFYILSAGPIPNHIAFIMDGNRRYARKKNLDDGAGHREGFLSLISMLRNCYELGVKYVTVYAFSIDNFQRDPNEVQSIMALTLEKIEGLFSEDSIVNEFGVRIFFIGDLRLLNEPVRNAAENIMRATANNTKFVLLVCVAYTSRDEIVRAAEECSADKIKEPSIIKVVDIERRMNMSVAPDPDLLIRTSGETRLSNFLLWQTSNCALYSPNALWPEIGLWHFVWGVITYQRNHAYLEKKKKQS